MKKISSIFLLLLNTSFSFSQSIAGYKTSWEKIIIEDAHGGWVGYNNHFTIKKSAGKILLKDKNDSLIKEIDPALITDLFNSFVSADGIEQDPLRMFGKDSAWLIANATELWKSYYSGKHFPRADSMAINTIKNYAKVKSVVSGLEGWEMAWTDDYPVENVIIIKGTDSIRITSMSQHAFMLPWNINGQEIFNSGTSIAIANLLPDNVETNRKRLRGERFSYELMEKIYWKFIEDKYNLMASEEKQYRQFKKLRKYFDIESADTPWMESIEWGGFFVGCLELSLHEKTTPANIHFSGVFGRPLGIQLHGVNPLIKQRKKILNQLKDNYVYKYTLNHPATGEIHFVNRRSFSKAAKRWFLGNVKESGQDKKQFKGKFKGAIFYELSEKDGYSRWIFLKDGTSILWEQHVKQLMDLDPVLFAEEGYVCRVIKEDEFKRASGK